MADRHEPVTAPDPDPLGDLAARLDALGRAAVAHESIRAEPPAAYLEAVSRRRAFAGFRPVHIAAAAAAALLLAAFIALSLRSPAPAPRPIASGPSTGPTAADPLDRPPTVATITSMNRAVTSPEALRLPAAGGGSDAAAPFRAADGWRADRIDAATSPR